ncbi:MAG: hypothetical protein HW421_2911 [Ignavibacteria bacterium]|nr:hypothetical protein [Ignavibacteria bacterium]
MSIMLIKVIKLVSSCTYPHFFTLHLVAVNELINLVFKQNIPKITPIKKETYKINR